jgi:ferredoxin-NADP reductase
MTADLQTQSVKVWSSRLLERRRLAVGTFEIRLQRPTGFDFQPGQHIALQIGRRERDYSLVSAPSEDELAILVRLIPAGQLTPVLDQAPIGTELTFSGPEGRFRFHPGPRPGAMVATGTGIAPFVAMIRAGAQPSWLLHGVRASEELYYRDELQAVVDRYVPCLSRDVSLPSGAFNGHVTRFLQTRPELGACDFYLAGRMAMIHDAIRIVDECFPSARVYTEAFF